MFAFGKMEERVALEQKYLMMALHMLGAGKMEQKKAGGFVHFPMEAHFKVNGKKIY